MAPSHLQEPGRSWWKSNPTSPRQQAFPSEKLPTRSKPSAGSKFNTIAHAIGLKSKRHPPLAIQEPPSPINTSHESTPPARYANRPPARSVSTVRSRDDSSEPRTPSDRERLSFPRSVLSMSDADPFASQGMSPRPHVVHDPNRLSAFSLGSISDIPPKAKEPFMPSTRSSYASTSSASYANHSSEDFSHSRPGTANSLSPKKRQWIKDAQRTRGASTLPPSNPVDDQSATHLTLNKSVSASTLKKPPVETDTSTMPRIGSRERGMTDSSVACSMSHFMRKTGLPPKAAFAAELKNSPPPTPPKTSPQPRVVVRQPSNSRISLPPSAAPPSSKLPPPPSGSRLGDSPRLTPEEISPHSASSSTLSFASSTSSRDLHRGLARAKSHHREKSRSVEDPLTRRLLETPDWELGVMDGIHKIDSAASRRAPQSIKRAASHQNLSKRASTATTSSVPGTPAVPSPLHDEHKGPRKQRSFHHPRIPMPPLPGPLRHANSFNQTAEPPVSESRRGSAGSIPRKRLFSGSSMRRPSTSQGHEDRFDDARSIFSLPPDDVVYPPPTTDSPAAQTFWDDGTQTPASPAPPSSDYVPQHIISPAELREVEASFDSANDHDDGAASEDAGRARGFSFASASTVPSDGPHTGDSMSMKGLSPPGSGKGTPASATGWGKSALPGRTSSLVAKTKVYPGMAVRPSTTQANMTPPASPSHASPPVSLTYGPPGGLQPPPRPRIRPATHPEPDRSSTVVLTPLSPPPRRKKTGPPPPAGVAGVQKADGGNRRSILKKPSFLEIDDEATKSPPTDNFLELRESFDSVHPHGAYN